MRGKYKHYVKLLLSIIIATLAIVICRYIYSITDNLKHCILIFAVLAFCVIIIYALIRFTKELVLDFLNSNFRGKIILAVIFTGYVFRAIYQMSLSK